MIKAKPYNDLKIASILVSLVLVMELTMFFFNHEFLLNFFGVINDIFIAAVLIFAVCFIRDTIAKKTVLTIVFVVMAVMYVADGIYSHHFLTLASIRSTFMLKSLSQGGVDMGKVQLTLAGAVIIFEAAIGVFFIWFIPVSRDKNHRFLQTSTSFLLATVITLASMNVSVVLSVKNKRYDSKIDYYMSNSFLYDEFYNNMTYATKFGYWNYRLRDIFYMGNKNVHDLDYEEFFDSHATCYESELTGLLEGYNVITVTCETLDTRIVDKTLMPNFTSIMERSLIFEDYYVPTFFPGATVNSEFATLTGTYPISSFYRTSTTAERYSQKDLSEFALPAQLKEAGYDTYYMHLGGNEFYSRKNLMPNMGFDTLKFIQDLDYEAQYYDYELADLLDYVDFSQKFYVDMLPFAMHKGRDKDYTSKDSPRYEDYKFVCENYPDVTKESKIYYTKARAFDQFVGCLWDRLEQENVADKTIILFYPDHYFYSASIGGVYSDLNIDVYSPEIYNLFMTMYLPDSIKQKVLETLDDASVKDGYETAVSVPYPCSSVDIAPTVLNLVTSSGNYKYFAGSDAFSGDNCVFLADYTVYDGNYFLNIDGSVVSKDDSKPSEDELDYLKSKLADRIDLILNSTAMMLNY